ncbi:MAG: MAPEG family protein [Wenzhouxiangellaceae bacterium]
MTAELQYLTLSAVFAALMWIPYIVDLLARNPIKDAVGYPDTPLRMAPWAERLKAAHYNSVENLVVFGALVLVLHLTEAGSSATETAAATYFWARIVHTISYTAAIPWVRTISFLVAWAAMIVIGWAVLNG